MNSLICYHPHIDIYNLVLCGIHTQPYIELGTSVNPYVTSIGLPRVLFTLVVRLLAYYLSQNVDT